MATSNKSLTQAIRGLYRDYMTDGRPAALDLAPLVGQDSSNGEFQILKRSKFYDARDTPLKVGGTTAFRAGQLEFDTVSVKLVERAGQAIHLPERAIRSLEAANPDLDVVKHAVDTVAQDLFGYYVADVQTIADSLDDASALDLSVNTAPLIDYFNTEILAIQKVTGKRPNVLYMGPEAYHALQNQDSVQQGSAVAVGSSATSTRRLGSVAPDAVDQFFLSRFGLRVLVENWNYVTTAGANDFVVTTQMVLAHSAPGTAPSCLKTFHQTIGRSGELIDFYQERATLPNKPGIFVAGDGMWEVKVVDAELGRDIPVTLPS